MKKLFLFLLVSSIAFAQGGIHNGIALKSTGVPASGASVRVCTSTATGTPCSPLAAIYSDAALANSIVGSVTTADANGNYHYYSVPGPYKEQVTVGSSTFTSIVLVAPDINSVPSLKVINSGAFSSSAMTTPFESMINSCDPQAEYQAGQGVFNSSLAVTGCAKAPTTATDELAIGTAGFASSLTPNQTEFGPGIPVGVYGQGRCLVNDCSGFGANFVFNEDGTHTNVAGHGIEVDVAQHGPSTNYSNLFGVVVSIGGNGSGLVTPSYAFEAGSQTSNLKWNWSLYSQAGASESGIFLGPTCQTGTCFAQGILLQGLSSGVGANAGIGASPTGDIILSPATNRYVSTSSLVLGGPVLDVRYFGAKCDGSTNDAAAIQAALTAANTAGGGRVMIPVAKCVIASPLSMDQFIGVSLEGWSATSGYGGTPKPWINYSGTTSPAINMRSTNKCALENLNLTYSNASFTGTVVDASHSTAADSYGNIFSNVFFSSSPITTHSAAVLLDLDKSIDTRVSESAFHGAGIALRGAVDNTSYSNSIKVLWNHFSSSTGDIVTALIQNPSTGWTIQGNTFEMGGALGSPCIVCFTSGSAGLASQGVQFSGNWIGDMTAGWGSGSAMSVGSGWSVTGNYFGGNTLNTAITVPNSTEGVSITGNRFVSDAVGVALGTSVSQFDFSANTGATTQITGTPTVGKIQTSTGTHVYGTLTVDGFSTGTAGSVGHATCWKTTTTIGYCSDVVSASGTCTCN